jgi:signal transduction histidine kinase
VSRAQPPPVQPWAVRVDGMPAPSPDRPRSALGSGAAGPTRPAPERGGAATTDASGPLIDRALPGGGEMGALIRAFDWASTPVGPFERWPATLRTAVSLLLASGYPMCLAWGADLLQFYNDAFRPILGASKHPGALGQPTPECFAEIWDVIAPMFDRVMAAGETVTYHDFELSLDRHGYLEECYFDYSYSPVREPGGDVGGVFVTCSETTGRVLGERRLRTLSELAAGVSRASTAEDACGLAVRTLAGNGCDIPFALLYLVDDRAGAARLAGVAGVAAAAAPASVDLSSAGAVSGGTVTGSSVTGDPRVGDPRSEPGAGVGRAVATVVTRRRALPIEDVVSQLGRIPGGPWPEPVERAYLVPIMQAAQAGGDRVTGVLVAGISPRRAFDDAYREFLDLVAGQVATALAGLRAYQEAIARAEALAELDRAKTAFFSNISHELRTPLTLALGPLADVLEEDVVAARGGSARLDAQDRERLELVQRNSLRLLRLVNSLLDFSRIEAGRTRATYRPVDLGRLTAEHCSAFRSAFESAGLRLEVECPRLPRPLHVDPEMWEKVVLNLLSNAFKHTFTGGVRVAVTDGGTDAVVSVADTGVGIPPEELPHVFERFHRVRSTRSRSFEGSGIGLALVRELVQLHGGTIEVESRLDRGTTFTITLPYGVAHLPADRVRDEDGGDRVDRDAIAFVEEASRWLPPTSAPAGRTPSSTTGEESGPPAADSGTVPAGLEEADVLVVEDNRDMRTYVSRVLGQNFRVETAANGEEALGRARSQPPDIIVSDVMMPGIDGFQLLQELRSDPSTAAIPVLLLSARAGDEATVEGLEAGADDYVTKPFSAQELIARVRVNLQMSRARAEAARSESRYESAQLAQRRALTVLRAVAGHLESASEPTGFFAVLTETIAHLVQARRVAFWLLDPERAVLSVQRGAHGFPPQVIDAMRDLPCRPGGGDVADLIVHQGMELHAANLDEPRFSPQRELLTVMGVHQAIATAWRAGDQPLGMLTAYDSTRPGGFVEEDTWVLRIAALAAGLVWKSRKAQEALEEMRRVETARLAARVDEFAELDRLKSQFLRLASHELRGPITVIRGYLDMLTTGSLGEVPPRLHRVHTMLASKATHMNHLVDQMLDTARLEDHRLVLTYSAFDLREVVRELVDELQPMTGSAHRFRLAVPDHPITVVADRSRIDLVLVNVMDNAVKYSPAGGDITVVCSSDPASARASVSVTDQGIGIDEADLPRVFTRFGRIVTRDNSHIPGTGLGLYLSREIARMHGGEITISSVGGSGTTVVVTLPLGRRVEAAAPAAERPGPA